MKKLILSILLFIGFFSCGYHVPMSDSVKFEVVDTLDIFHKNHPFIMTNYFVIIKMDSSFYSAKVNDSGDLYEIVRKLKIKN